jgi:hypothetical protein
MAALPRYTLSAGTPWNPWDPRAMKSLGGPLCRCMRRSIQSLSRYDPCPTPQPCVWQLPASCPTPQYMLGSTPCCFSHTFTFYHEILSVFHTLYSVDLTYHSSTNTWFKYCYLQAAL